MEDAAGAMGAADVTMVGGDAETSAPEDVTAAPQV